MDILSAEWAAQWDSVVVTDKRLAQTKDVKSMRAILELVVRICVLADGAVFLQRLGHQLILKLKSRRQPCHVKGHEPRGHLFKEYFLYELSKLALVRTGVFSKLLGLPESQVFCERVHRAGRIMGIYTAKKYSWNVRPALC